MTTVKLLIGANAYATIREPGRCLDVLLQPGRSAAQSLRETAQELQTKAAAELARAECMLRAAAALESVK